MDKIGQARTFVSHGILVGKEKEKDLFYQKRVNKKIRGSAH